MELLTALEETWDGIRRLLAGVQGDEWALPTPCTEWDVHNLAAHLGAIESQFQGLPQPDPESPPPDAGIDGWTAAGVKARRQWSALQVLDEIEAASNAQLDHLRGLDEAGWSAPRFGPLGETDETGLAEIRVLDLYLHLLDLRVALGRPLDFDAEPTACRRCVDRAVDLTPWGAVKRAGLADGTRVRLDLADPAGRVLDLVVEGGRGRLDPPDGEPAQWVRGPAPAYLLATTGRPAGAEIAGGVKAEGDDAAALLERFRIFG